jgi:hypothetical protein
MQATMPASASFIRTAQNAILYTTADYCRFLAARYVERKTAPAQREYTRVADITSTTP